MKENKIWGITNKIFSKNNVEIHRIEVIKGGYCSKHYHEYKFNGFYCEKGELQIQVWKTDSTLIDVTMLGKGDYTIVEPKTYHKFLATRPSIVYEIYWVELSAPDIVRQVVGGNLNT